MFLLYRFEVPSIGCTVPCQKVTPLFQWRKPFLDAFLEKYEFSEDNYYNGYTGKVILLVGAPGAGKNLRVYVLVLQSE